MEDKIWFVVINAEGRTKLFKIWRASIGEKLQTTYDPKEACAFHNKDEAQTCANNLNWLLKVPCNVMEFNKKEIYG
jgi:hypothetical protein